MATPYRSIDVSDLPRVQVRTIGMRDQGPGEWSLRGALNARWIYYCNDRDGSVIHTAGGSMPLAAGRLVLVPAGCRFDTECNANVRHLFGYFDAPGLSRYRFDQLIRPLMAAPAPDDAVFRELAANPGHPPGPALVLRLAARISQALAEALPAATLIDADGRHERIAPACQLIDANYHQALTNHELAAACGMSGNTFLRHFRAATGISPAQAVRQRRVQAAILALIHSDEPFDRIASRCGFPNRQYFARVFSAHMGMSPSAYRRRNRRTDTPHP